jgi:hypothetical protein
VVEKSRLTRWCEIQIRRHEHAQRFTPHPHHLVNSPDEVLGTVNDECGTPALGQRDAVRSGAVTLNGWALECCFDVLGRIGRIHGADEFVRIGSGQSKGIRVTGRLHLFGIPPRKVFPAALECGEKEVLACIEPQHALEAEVRYDSSRSSGWVAPQASQ